MTGKYLKLGMGMLPQAAWKQFLTVSILMNLIKKYTYKKKNYSVGNSNKFVLSTSRDKNQFVEWKVILQYHSLQKDHSK